MGINNIILIYGLIYRQQSCYKGKVYLSQYNARTATLFRGSEFRLYGYVAYSWKRFYKGKGVLLQIVKRKCTVFIRGKLHVKE